MNLKPPLHIKIQSFDSFRLCYMVQLVKNCWVKKKLVNLDEVEGLHAAYKIRKRNLQYSKEKM